MKPIVVDLDGTLLKTDTLIESFIKFIRENPFNLFYCFVWLMAGKSFLKEKLSKSIVLDVDTLPFDENLLAWLKKEKRKGTPIFLATGAAKSVAKQVSNKLGIFDDYFSSSEKMNLIREKKRDFLIKKFGVGGFHYVGNGTDDIAI